MARDKRVWFVTLAGVILLLATPSAAYADVLLGPSIVFVGIALVGLAVFVIAFALIAVFLVVRIFRKDKKKGEGEGRSSQSGPVPPLERGGS